MKYQLTRILGVILFLGFAITRMVNWYEERSMGNLAHVILSIIALFVVSILFKPPTREN